tara:strand:- start:254 stop:376 length:123 start_codon:yes stop_codon:yes gene_type:complete
MAIELPLKRIDFFRVWALYGTNLETEVGAFLRLAIALIFH